MGLGVVGKWQVGAIVLLSAAAAALAALGWLAVGHDVVAPSQLTVSPAWLLACLTGHFAALAILGGNQLAGLTSAAFLTLLRCTTLGWTAGFTAIWLQQGRLGPVEIGSVVLQWLIQVTAEWHLWRRAERGPNGLANWLAYAVVVGLATAGSTAVERAAVLNAPRLADDIQADAPLVASPAVAADNAATPIASTPRSLGSGANQPTTGQASGGPTSQASGGPTSQASGEASSQASVATGGEASEKTSGESAGQDPLQQQRAARAGEAATVRVVNQTRGLWGSGAIVAAGDGAAYVLTASHLAAPGDELVIQRRRATGRDGTSSWGGEGAAECLAQDLDSDLALLSVPLRRRDAPPPPSVVVCPLADAPDTPHVDVTVCASNEQGLPQSEADTVTAKRVRRRPGAAAVDVWEGQRPSDEGDSGGAVIDHSGRLIGVRSGIGDGRSYYCHLADVQRFLAQAGIGGKGPQDTPRVD